MNWIPIDALITPEEGVEMIAFHPEWINEDFNPKGIRVGFFDGDESFVSAKWIDHQDSYIEDNTVMPTHYMSIPDNPIQEEENRKSLIRWRKNPDSPDFQFCNE
jgi:hypothetical protein